MYSQPTDDSHVWKATIDDSYTVKSAYSICIDLLHEFAPSNNSHWKLLNRKMPPRVRAFIWWTMHQCLRTRVNLSSRGIPCNESCNFCELLAESHIHIFFACSKTIECSNRIGIGNIIWDLLLGANNFSVTLFDLFHMLKDQDRPSAAMILWSLWKCRNTKLSEASDTSPTFTVSRAHDVLHEWICMQQAKHLTSPQDQQPV